MTNLSRSIRNKLINTHLLAASDVVDPTLMVEALAKEVYENGTFVEMYDAYSGRNV